MTHVGSRKLKNRLGSFLARVRAGETILITDRGRPIAKLTPTGEPPGAERTVEELLQQLAAKGQVHLASQRVDARQLPAARVKGKPLSQLILEDRD